MKYFRITGLNRNRDLHHEWKRLDEVLGQIGGRRVLGNPQEEFSFERDDFNAKMLSYVVNNVVVMAYAAQNPYYARIAPSVRGDVEIDFHSVHRRELEQVIEKLRDTYPILKEREVETIFIPQEP